LRVALVHREADAEVRVVIEIGAGRDDPVNKAGFDERNQRGNPETRGRQRSGQRNAHRDFRFEHFLREQLTRFTQSRGVVGKKCFVD
jgi:hypothetical protein